MDKIEYNYQQATKFLELKDFYHSVFWSRNVLEQLVKTIYLSYKPDGNIRGNNLNSLIKEIEKKELVPKMLISHFRTIQTFANQVIHDEEIIPEEIAEKDVEPVTSSLKYILNWYREELKPSYLKRFDKQQIFDINVMVETSSNPFYFDDIKKVENGFLKSDEILRDNVILIVTGHDLHAELIDRPIAEMVRNSLEMRFKALRGIIISDNLYESDSVFSSMQVISIGSPEHNSLSKKLLEMAPMEDNAHRFIDVSLNNLPAVAFWGSSTNETKMIAASFIEDKAGLEKFAWLMLEH